MGSGSSTHRSVYEPTKVRFVSKQQLAAKIKGDNTPDSDGSAANPAQGKHDSCESADKTGDPTLEPGKCATMDASC